MHGNRVVRLLCHYNPNAKQVYVLWANSRNWHVTVVVIMQFKLSNL
jgi:hypothetical protein